MRYELDENGYVLNVFWGCHSGKCTEYTGTVPSGYSDLTEWSEKAIINAYYLVDGNLTLDSNRNYKLQLIQKQEAEENACVTKKEMGIASTDEMNPYTDLFPSHQSTGGYIVTVSEEFNKVGNLPTEEVNLSVLEEQNLDFIELEFIGNNFLPNSASNSINNGIKYSRNIDKTINVSGTATDRSTLSLAGTDTSVKNILTFKANTHYLLFGLEGTSLEFYNYDGLARTLIGTYSGGIISFAEDINITQVVLVVDKGTSINTTIKPMLKLVNLEYPVMPMTKYKGNLVGLTDGTYTNKGITATVENGIITLNGTATETSFVSIPLTANYDIKDGEKFTVSANNPVTNSNVRIRIDYNGKYDTTLNSVNKVITHTKSSEQSVIGKSIQTRVQSGTTLENYVIKPQLERGTATEYKLYNGRDGQYYVDGVSTQKTSDGKNLYNVNDVYNRATNYVTTDKEDWMTITRNNSSGTSTTYVSNYVNPSSLLKTNTDYYFIVEIKEVSGTGRITFVSNGTGNNKGQFNTTKTYNLEDLTPNSILKITGKTRSSFDGCVTMLRHNSAFDGGDSGSITYRMSIFENEEDANNFIYEPFGITPRPDYPSEIINIYKAGTYNAITDNRIYTFTIPEDLRSVPSAADRLWIDVNGDNGIDIERKVVRIVLDGDENFAVYQTETENWYYNLYFGKNMFITNACMSSHYKKTTIYTTNTNQGIYNTSEALRIRYGEVDTVDNFKNWLSNNNVEVYLELGAYTTSFLPEFYKDEYEYEEYKNNTTLIDLAGNKLTIPDKITIQDNQIVLFKGNNEIYLGDTVMPRTYTPYTHAYCHQKVFIDFKYKDPRNVDITKITLEGLLSITNIESQYNFTSEDYNKIKNYIMETGDLTDEEIELYDVNGDGRITASDYVIIKQMVDGTISNTIKGTFEINTTKSQRVLVLRDENGKIKTSIGLNGATTPSISTEQLILDGTKQPKIMSGISLPEEVTEDAVFLLYDE